MLSRAEIIIPVIAFLDIQGSKTWASDGSPTSSGCLLLFLTVMSSDNFSVSNTLLVSYSQRV